MFVRYFVELPARFQDVEEALLAESHTWVPAAAGDAEEGGDRLLAEVGFGSDGHRIEKRVEVDLEAPIRLLSKTILPMRWRAEGAGRLFPSLDADIEVAALGSERTQLSISGRYRPPLGPAGRAMDRMLLHRVAEATIKDFLERIGAALRSATVAVFD